MNEQKVFELLLEFIKISVDGKVSVAEAKQFITDEVTKDLPEVEKQAVIEMIPSIIDTFFSTDDQQNLHIKEPSIKFNCNNMQIAAILVLLSSVAIYALNYANHYLAN